MLISHINFRFRTPNKTEFEDSFDSHQGPVDAATAQQQQHQQFLGDASGALPNFGTIDTSKVPLPEGVTLDHIKAFEKMHKEHAEVSFI